jgi:hypothetical protein
MKAAFTWYLHRLIDIAARDARAFERCGEQDRDGEAPGRAAFQVDSSSRNLRRGSRCGKGGQWVRYRQVGEHL